MVHIQSQQKVSIDKKVLVRIAIDDSLAAVRDKLEVYFIDESHYVPMNASCVEIAGTWYIEFTTDHFSTYAIAEQVEKDKGNDNKEKHSSSKRSSSKGGTSVRDKDVPRKAPVLDGVWRQALERIKNTKTGGSVLIELSQDQSIPVEVLQGIAGKDVTLVFKHSEKEIELNGKSMQKIPTNKTQLTLAELSELVETQKEEIQEIESGTSTENPQTGGDSEPSVVQTNEKQQTATNDEEILADSDEDSTDSAAMKNEEQANTAKETSNNTKSQINQNTNKGKFAALTWVFSL